MALYRDIEASIQAEESRLAAASWNYKESQGHPLMGMALLLVNFQPLRATYICFNPQEQDTLDAKEGSKWRATKTKTVPYKLIQ